MYDGKLVVDEPRRLSVMGEGSAAKLCWLQSALGKFCLYCSETWEHLKVSVLMKPLMLLLKLCWWMMMEVIRLLGLFSFTRDLPVLPSSLCASCQSTHARSLFDDEPGAMGPGQRSLHLSHSHDLPVSLSEVSESPHSSVVGRENWVCEEGEALGPVLYDFSQDTFFLGSCGLEVCLLPTYLSALESIACNLEEGTHSASLCYKQLVSFCPPGQLGLEPDHLGVFLTVFTDVMCIPMYDSFKFLYTAELVSALDFVRVITYFHDPRYWRGCVFHLCFCEGNDFLQQKEWCNTYDHLWKADVNMFDDNPIAREWAHTHVPGLLNMNRVVDMVEEATILSQKRLAMEQSTSSSLSEGRKDWVHNAIWSINACDLEHTVEDALWEIDTSFSPCGVAYTNREDLVTDSSQASVASSESCSLGFVLEGVLSQGSLLLDIDGLEVCLLPTYLHVLKSAARNLGEGSLSAFLCYNQLVDFCPPGQPGLELDHLGVFLTVLTDVMNIPMYDSFNLLYTAELISATDFVRVLSYFHDPRRWKDLVLHLCSCDGAQ